MSSSDAQSGRGLSSNEGDGYSVVAYVQSVVKARPEVDARTLLAEATYVFEAEGFARVRRAAEVELRHV